MILVLAAAEKNIKNAVALNKESVSIQKVLASPRFFSVLTGILLFLSFPPFSLGFLAWVALLPLYHAIAQSQSRGEAFLKGYLAGIVFFLVGLDWLWHVTSIGWLLAAAFEALFLGVFALILFETGCRVPWFLRILQISLAWVALELLRAKFPILGLGWNLLGYSQAGYSWILQSANVAGGYGLSFVIVMVNGCLWECVGQGKKKIWQPIFLMVLMGAGIFSHGIYHEKQAGEKIGDLRISLIQGNIPQSVKWELVARDKILEIYSTLTQLAGYDDSSLIIWPEAAFPGYFHQDIAADDTRALVAKLGVPLLVGTTLLESEDVAYNSALLLGPDGKDKGRYDKLHLVPFGEYMPMKWALGWLTPFAYSLGISDFTAGHEKTVFGIFNEEISFSVLICFEDTFPELARDFVEKGAQFLAVITNDAWFQMSAAAAQHLQASLFRAVENGVPVVRAANTGISAFISNRGKVLGQIEDEKGNPLFVTGRKTMTLPIEVKNTIFRKGGWLFPYAASAGFIIIFLLTRRFRAEGQGAPKKE